MKDLDIRLVCIILMFALLFMLTGCGVVEDTAAEAEAKVELEARPVRLKVVSKELNTDSWTHAFVIQDTETGEEFIVVRERRGSVAITPIKGR